MIFDNYKFPKTQQLRCWTCGLPINQLHPIAVVKTGNGKQFAVHEACADGKDAIRGSDAGEA